MLEAQTENSLGEATLKLLSSDSSICNIPKKKSYKIQVFQNKNLTCSDKILHLISAFKKLLKFMSFQIRNWICSSNLGKISLLYTNLGWPSLSSLQIGRVVR